MIRVQLRSIMGPSTLVYFLIAPTVSFFLVDFDNETLINQYVINVELVGEDSTNTLSTSLRTWPQWFRPPFVCKINPQTPGAQHNPLVSMLTCISDVCSFTLYVSPLAFYHLYIDNNPPETHKENRLWTIWTISPGQQQWDQTRIPADQSRLRWDRALKEKERLLAG